MRRCGSVPKIPDRGFYGILAQWDRVAGVRVAESEDVPGLVAEGDSPKALALKLRNLIPELLELKWADVDWLRKRHH